MECLEVIQVIYHVGITEVSGAMLRRNFEVFVRVLSLVSHSDNDRSVGSISFFITL